jgi:hypothetical protein
MLGSYGSGSDSDDASVNSSGSDAEDSDVEEPKKKAAPVTSLPSADDMFADTSIPNFLDQKTTAEPVIVPIKSKESANPLPSKQTEPDDSQLRAEAEKKRARNEDAEIDRLKASVAATEAKKKQKIGNAKDRVKGQRLKGQAGIGSDFKTWKSDAEMVMRQQFD